eukprot:Colp12_sorted_trinity150504_noHs@7458
MVVYLFSSLASRLLGLLYPAYASFKAIKNRNLREYQMWLMYWVVFAFFSAFEFFGDVLLSWFPFYYEFKLFFVLWLIMPQTRGAYYLYRQFVHPTFKKE